MDTLSDIAPALRDGAWVTVQLTLGGTVIALVLAFATGLAATSPRRWVRAVVRAYMEFVRGTSVIVQLIFVFLVLPKMFGYKFDSALTAGIVVIGLSMGAYGSEIVRGALQAVPVPQREAAVALNFTPYQRLRYVLFPQALVGMLPPMNNMLIELLKSTALVTAISLGDLIYQADDVMNSGADKLTTMLAVMTIYLVFALLITLLMRLLERRAARVVGREVPPLFRRPTAPPVTADAGGAA
ncbi:ectoine/hydroxyectoine ABC transporter permease subunit EhuC [Spirillospora sp. CA-294931]|uniref:ectoine/hydroxyectoine ABC transporter permease subunit EhuC n=1 Tax=Spirillospora sp. CA-294931 TaxID=3240042 RepID=UPI003D8D4629